MKRIIIKNNRGMTLMEIMIVLVIVGMVATLATTQVVKQLDKAKVKETLLKINELSKNLDMFYTDCGFYPTTEQGLHVLLEAPTGEPTCSNWTEPYIKKMPIDAWKSEFVYEQNGSSFVIKSYGKDKKEGGTGLDKDLSNEDN
jgi:general secretion pathway protein G